MTQCLESKMMNTGLAKRSIDPISCNSRTNCCQNLYTEFGDYISFGMKSVGRAGNDHQDCCFMVSCRGWIAKKNLGWCRWTLKRWNVKQCQKWARSCEKIFPRLGEWAASYRAGRPSYPFFSLIRNWVVLHLIYSRMSVCFDLQYRMKVEMSNKNNQWSRPFYR